VAHSLLGYNTSGSPCPRCNASVLHRPFRQSPQSNSCIWLGERRSSGGCSEGAPVLYPSSQHGLTRLSNVPACCGSHWSRSQGYCFHIWSNRNKQYGHQRCRSVPQGEKETHHHDTDSPYTSLVSVCSRCLHRLFLRHRSINVCSTLVENFQRKALK
jgi:hypothetical protein